MAITCITGIPRSGKSYYCVYLLYMCFVFKVKVTKFSKLLDKYLGKYSSKKLKKSYQIAYTNINQFNFSASDRIKPFDYDVIYLHLVNLHKMYLLKKSDDELIFYAKANHLYESLFVIDECQNFFSKDEPVLTWWFTYHGHLHQDIILITQNFDLIFGGYTKLGEFFYKAVPPSSRIFSNKFRYVQYNSYKCYQKDKIGDFNVPMLPDVFKLYVSGASNNAPSQVKKYLFYALILFIILMIVFIYFMSMFGVKKSSQKPTQNVSTPVSQSVQHQSRFSSQKNNFEDFEDDNKTVLFEIKCIENLCRYKGVDFPRTLLTKIIRDERPSYVSDIRNGSYTHMFLMLPKKSFDFIQKDDETKPKKGFEKNGATNFKISNPLTSSNKSPRREN